MTIEITTEGGTACFKCDKLPDGKFKIYHQEQPFIFGIGDDLDIAMKDYLKNVREAIVTMKMEVELLKTHNTWGES